ncbi:MAG: SET domain-containing protein [Flavobacterium sp.]
MIHPDTKISFISPEKGYGVVATKFIPKGTITWVQDELDRVFKPSEASKLNPFTKKYLDKYCFTNKLGELVLCWDNGKFVNHSFKPNCFSTAYDFEIAIKDILPGEELTDDYGYLNVEEPFEVIDEGTDRKTVFPDDLLNFHAEWDLIIKNNAPYVLQVNQPLLPLIKPYVWEEFITAVEKPNQMRSLLECYYERKEVQTRMSS